MKAATPNNLFRLFNMFFTLLSLCFASRIHAGELNYSAESMAVAAAVNVEAMPTNHIPVQPAIENSDEGKPLAREDVIGLRFAVRGTSPTPVPGNNAPSVTDGQAKISSRFSDSKMLSFLSRTNMQQLASVYLETSQMIDARHVSPISYRERVQGATQNVINALQNETFLRVNGASMRLDQIQAVQNELWSMVQSQPAQTANEAVGVMQFAADLVNRRLGIRREAVALEFLNGTLDTMDKFSAFMPESSGVSPGAEIDLIRTAGLEEKIVGVGVELQQHAQGAELAGVVENSPASELGLLPGDIIIAVDMQSMVGRNLNEIADRIGGRAGTTVTVDILRDGRKFRGTMVRRQVYVGSVSGTTMIDSQNRIGYIKLKQFSESSAEDLEKALWTLHNQGMKSLILDLRGNPGGLLDESIDVANLFLPCGTIVSTKGRNASDNSSETATYEKTWAVPMVVLVDENSASASEILAAAIQENQRGVLVGRNSYGKGTVQTHFPMRTVPATLKLTTAKFYSPTGREMAGAGVHPDVPVQVTTTGYRGLQNDADVQTAVQVVLQGTPAQLAAQSANCRVKTGLTSNNLNFQQLPLNIFDR